MDPLARRFVSAALAWLAVGTAAGLVLTVPALADAVHRWGGRPVAVHAHLQLYGFVTMMIFGIALHALPRFEGRPLPRPGMARAQFAAANAGLALFAAGQLAGRQGAAAAGGVLMALAVALFIAQLLHLWRTDRAPGKVHRWRSR